MMDDIAEADGNVISFVYQADQLSVLSNICQVALNTQLKLIEMSLVLQV